VCCEEAIAAEDNFSLTGPFAAQGCSYRASGRAGDILAQRQNPYLHAQIGVLRNES